MKKLVMFAVIGLLLSTTAFARVVVLQDGKTMTFADNSEIVVSGKYPSRVLYDGVLITVPPNQKVTIEKKDGKLVLSGTNLDNIEVGGNKISSNGQAIVAIAPDTLKITVLKGEVIRNDSLTNKNTVQKSPVKVAAVNQPNNTTPVVAETVEFPEVSDYVNEVTSQQSVQDVEDMSPASPRY